MPFNQIELGNKNLIWQHLVRYSGLKYASSSFIPPRRTDLIRLCDCNEKDKCVHPWMPLWVSKPDESNASWYAME